MKTLLSLLLCSALTALGAGFFMNQQGQSGITPPLPVSGFDFSDYFTAELSIIPQQDPALSDGASISTATDLSGNSRHFTQSTTAAKPTWKTGATSSGMASILFDGGDDWMTAGDVLDLGLNSRTIFIALKRNSGNAGLLCKSLAASAGGRWAAFIESGAANTLWTSGGTVYSSSGSDTDTGWQLLTCVLNRASGTLIRKNGVQIASNASAESVGNQQTTYALLLGAYNNGTDGLTPVAGFYLNGEIAAVGVCNSALSTGTIEDVEDALGAYLGITITH
jgi:hypothetical protein